MTIRAAAVLQSPLEKEKQRTGKSDEYESAALRRSRAALRLEKREQRRSRLRRREAVRQALANVLMPAWLYREQRYRTAN